MSSTLAPLLAWPSTGGARATSSAAMASALPTDVRHLDFFALRRLGGSDSGIPVGALLPYRRDLVAQDVVGGAVAQQPLQVVPGLREQAGVERAFGREAHARAARAERLGDRGDDADLARAVGVAPALGNL